MSAPVLGFDLTRMGGGPATAEVLLHALRLTAPALAIMAEHLLADDARAELWLEVETAAARMPTVSRGLDPAVTSRDDPTGDPPAPRAGESNAALLRALQLAPIGTVDALLRLVRYDILAWTWSGTGLAASQEPLASQATALLCDAAVAAYLRDVLSPRTRRRLAAPWISAQRRLPELPPIDLGPHQLAVTALLERLRTVSSTDAQRLTIASDEARAREGVAWAGAVHAASWAAHISDRIRVAASGQLLLVQALDHDVITLADRAGGVWNMLSGAVQAVVVRDLLDEATTHRLLAPVIGALGPAWLM
ncbi:hypothetical protein [Luedemannella flava]|uniref:hypothetical protein n=1 Tax=Luedemannella flava TaxID=349316 RepID=UPI0031D7683A